MAEANFRLTKAQIDEFQATGAICLRQVLDDAWVEKVATGINKNLENPSQYSEKLANLESNSSSVDSGGYYFNDYCNWKSIPEFVDYVYNSPAASIAGQLTGSSYVAMYHEHVLVKSAGSSRETPWHVDQSYYPIDGTQVCSIWMPIDPIGLESTIQFVEGSHLWPEWFRPRKFATTLNYETIAPENDNRTWADVPSAQELVTRARILQWAVEPGDCIVFHMKTLHGAPGNLSKLNQRRILSTRWLGKHSARPILITDNDKKINFCVGDDAVIASRPWIVSPPIYGGLKVGDKAVSAEFPVVWTRS